MSADFSFWLITAVVLLSGGLMAWHGLAERFGCGVLLVIPMLAIAGVALTIELAPGRPSSTAAIAYLTVPLWTGFCSRLGFIIGALIKGWRGQLP